MTPDDARKKVCPLTLIPVPDGAGGAYQAPYCCIAQDCISWNEELGMCDKFMSMYAARPDKKYDA